MRPANTIREYVRTIRERRRIASYKRTVKILLIRPFVFVSAVAERRPRCGDQRWCIVVGILNL